MVYKNCKCRGTSSGPRVINKFMKTGDSYVIIFSEERMVCDVCDEPWVDSLDKLKPELYSEKIEGLRSEVQQSEIPDVKQ